MLAAQYVDDRNLLEVLQDDLDTAKVHAHLSPGERRTVDEITLQVIMAAAKQRAHKPYDKAGIRTALKTLTAMMESKVFATKDVGLLKDDVSVVALGLDGKVDIDAPRRARGSVY